MSDKKQEIKRPEKSQPVQDKPKPYPLRSVLEGVPPTAHGISIISNKKGVLSDNQRGVRSNNSEIIVQDKRKKKD